LSVKGSWGYYRQTQGIHELDVVDGDTLFRGSERAQQVAVGVEGQLRRGWHGRIEAYSRVVADPRPIYVNLARDIAPIMQVEGDRTRLDLTGGRAKGIEFSLSNEKAGRWSWSGSYALAWAEHEVGQAWSPTMLDQRHTVNIFAAYHWGRAWQLSGSWQYHTGWPITERSLEVVVAERLDSGEQARIVRDDFGALNGARLPAYHRLDLRVTRNIDIGRSRLELFLDIFNVYNRENIRSYLYSLIDPDGDGLYTVRREPGLTLLPIMPTLGLRWVF
jgi:outer membrane receptor protein involved in Fe transport